MREHLHENQRKNKDRHSPKKAKDKPFSPKIKAKILSKWNKLLSKDVDAMNGSMSLLASKIQETYNCPKLKAESECEEFKRLNMLA